MFVCLLIITAISLWKNQKPRNNAGGMPLEIGYRGRLLTYKTQESDE